MPVYLNCWSTKFSSKSISFWKTPAVNSSWMPGVLFLSRRKSTFWFWTLVALHFCTEWQWTNPRDITGLGERDPQRSAQRYLLGVGADAADEEGLSFTQGLQQLAKRSLKRNRQKHLLCLQISPFWVVFGSSTASSSAIRFFQVWSLHNPISSDTELLPYCTPGFTYDVTIALHLHIRMRLIVQAN